jgi:Domain of unknown function (DUF4351)
LTKKGSERADNDGGWKEILRVYFPQAIQFFFPATANLIDWAQPIEFLDTQLQQITKEAEVGRRFADLLVKVALLNGNEAWLCLHLEVQANKEVVFPKRLLVYNMRIFELFDKPAISLAILTDNNSQWRPTDFAFEYPDTALNFRFGMIKLLDYKSRLEELEASDNPFAVVVMAHLQAQANRRDALGRKNVKFTLIRSLYERGFPQQDILNLFRFIDWVIRLPDSLKQQFWQELRNFEEQRHMPYITSVEQIGIEKGEQIGFERGLQEGERTLILRQLTRQVGKLPATSRKKVEALPLAQLEALGEALLGFTSLADLQTWLEENPNP